MYGLNDTIKLFIHYDHRTQIIQGDSLKLAPGTVYGAGIQQLLPIFQEVATAKTTEGDPYQVPLNKVNAILMNPPFTKVERGIAKFVEMQRFGNRTGREVG